MPPKSRSPKRISQSSKRGFDGLLSTTLANMEWSGARSRMVTLILLESTRESNYPRDIDSQDSGPSSAMVIICGHVHNVPFQSTICLDQETSGRLTTLTLHHSLWMNHPHQIQFCGLCGRQSPHKPVPRPRETSSPNTEMQACPVV